MDWGLTIGSWQVYFFGLLTALSALFSLVAADRGLRRRGLRDGTGALFAALAVFLGFLFSRLLYCLCVIDYLEGSGDYLEIFRLTNGGYTLFGALLGVCLAGLITGKISGQKSGRILDCAAVSLAVFVAAVRVIASFVEQGRGMDLEYFFAPGEEDPAYRFSLLKLEDYSFFQRFPFAVEADGSWYWAVFVLETLAALCIALYLYRRKDLKDGGRITLFMMLYAACQIPLEAMKRGVEKLHKMGSSMGLEDFLE